MIIPSTTPSIPFVTRSKKVLTALIIFIIAPLTVLSSAVADGIDALKAQEGKREFQQALSSLKPQPSLSEMPIHLNIAGVEYIIPRNYIFRMDDANGKQPTIVTLRVNLADMSPLNASEMECLDARNNTTKSDCDPFNFSIQGHGQKADEALANLLRAIPHSGPTKVWGFDQYMLGSHVDKRDFNGNELYRIAESDYVALYECSLFENRGIKDGICYTQSDPLPSGAQIAFIFRLERLKSITETENKLRALVEGFTVSKGPSR